MNDLQSIIKKARFIMKIIDGNAMSRVTLTHVLMCLLFFTSLCKNTQAANLHAEEYTTERTKYDREVDAIIQKVKKAVETRDFSILKMYVQKKPINKWHKGPLYLAECNSDVGEDISYNEMEKFLLDKSTNAKIYINEDVAYGELIETTGWVGDRLYIYFDFTKTDGKWRWLGVCDDVGRSLDYSEYLKGKKNRKDENKK